MNIEIEKLKEMISYSPKSGILTWNKRPIDHFSSKRAFSTWNSRYSGNECGDTSVNGYRRMSINYKRYLSHRVAWAIFYGEWPDGFIDHINGVRDDNRMSNLRCVSNSENSKNSGIKSSNKSGVSGVVWCSRTGKWQVSITVNYKNIFLGRYKEISEAKNARKLAELKFGFHKNHGDRLR